MTQKTKASKYFEFEVTKSDVSKATPCLPNMCAMVRAIERKIGKEYCSDISINYVDRVIHLTQTSKPDKKGFKIEPEEAAREFVKSFDTRKKMELPQKFFIKVKEKDLIGILEKWI